MTERMNFDASSGMVFTTASAYIIKSSECATQISVSPITDDSELPENILWDKDDLSLY